MTETQSLAIDIIKLVPDNSTCFINAPSIDKDSAALKLFQRSTRNYDWQLTLTSDNKQKLIDIIISENIEREFHRLDIKHNDTVLFIAYDGICGVEVKKDINVPDWFAKKYADTLMF